MVNMAEAEPAAMFLTASQHRLQGLDMMSDMDSEPDEAPSMLMMRPFHHQATSELKRNKRKNFQPRNISYCEDTEQFRRTEPETSGDSADDGSEALDLSSSDLVPSASKRFRKTLLNVPPVKRFNESAHESRSTSHDNQAPVPMDLSCSKNSPQNDYPEESVHSETESNSGDSERTESVNCKRDFVGLGEQPSPHQYLLHHAFLNQPQDASDLKEYAQNTVKELLEIYGLNSAEVAESITNNVPISNFNSGKILESLSSRVGMNVMGLRGMALPPGPASPGSQPPTPPRTPLSPHKAASSPVQLTTTHRPSGTRPPSVETMAAKFAGLSSNNNSRVNLPQNMATILALAAMQDRQGSVKTPGSSASTPSTSNNESPVSLTGTPRMTLSPNSAVRDPNKVSTPLDYSRYVRRFSSALECNSSYCKDLNYREHFHCLDCNSRVFVKKEEMIRHFKWHKKRDESLQHGFMRYSPSDDCSDRYHNCTHNRKQTHYHCIQGTCDKVYISTSDVQMHANYHRKDSAIIQEGFQRLRATEECRTPYCSFFGQRTTHFHCRRDHCQFTFKNKADMEKHKTYHIKDEQLARDGFKKFLKPDICGFANCRFSQVCNHIHCVRDGCSYVLHSSGQLLSHKRKHERKDTEIAYRKFKLAQQAVVNLANNEHLSQHGDSPGSSLQLLQQASSFAALSALHADSNFSNSSSEGRASPTRMQQRPLQFKLGSATSPAPVYTPPGPTYRGDSPASITALDLSSEEGNDAWSHYTPAQLCIGGPKCSLYQSDHYHCKEPGCEMPFRCRESAEGHAKMHETQERINDNFVQDGIGMCSESCPREHHFHCTWDGCSDIVLPNERFDHYRNHEIAASQNNSLDALFRRKRGRPPKNRVIEVWNDYAGGVGCDSPQAIFTSFKLPKPAPLGTPQPQMPDSLDPRTPSPATENPARQPPSLQMLEMHGFQAYNDGCPDPLCLFSGKPLHFHCSRQRCFFATDSDEQLLAHSKDFHDSIEILDGFLFFDRSVDCRLESCVSNKVNRHFHCIRPGCGYSFVRYSSMSLHQAKHLVENTGGMSCGGDTHTSGTLDLSSNENRGGSEHQPMEQEESPIKEALQSQPQNAPVSMAQSQQPLSHSYPQSPLQVPQTLPLQHPTTPGHLTPVSNSQNTSENGSPVNSAARTTVVKASGTFYPLCGLTNARSSPPSTDMVVKSEPMSEPGHTLPEWMNVERHERYGPDLSCSRPFCKLKRKEHYHCNACNQAFSELERLRPHIAKHSPSAIPPILVKQEHNNNEEAEEHPHPALGMMPMKMEGSELLPPPPPPHYPGFGAAMAAAVANQQLAMMTSQGLPFLPHAMPALYTSPSGLMFAAPPGFNPHHAALMSNGLLESARASMLGAAAPELNTNESLLARRAMSPETKKARVQTSMRILKDEPVPEGYVRFRFNEDCRYNHCGYREHQTHFHCMRQDCGYSFCDKTRFVQHTARHERLDTLMGGDFQQYRANVSCGRPECVYTATLGTGQNKASHFHCLKCDFVCTDTNKVVAHRRHHQKLDSIMAAGFEKFTPTQPCSAADTCIHSKKQTHYHCLSCQYAVLGLSQMTAHKYRHLE